MENSSIILITSGGVCLVLAVLVGEYRQFCIYKDKKYSGVDTPLIWSFLWFRVLSWLFVAATSLWAAVLMGTVVDALAAPLVSIPGNLAFGFAFGATFGLRWGLSALLAMKVMLGRI